MCDIDSTPANAPDILSSLNIGFFSDYSYSIDYGSLLPGGSNIEPTVLANGQPFSSGIALINPGNSVLNILISGTN